MFIPLKICGLLFVCVSLFSFLRLSTHDLLWFHLHRKEDVKEADSEKEAAMEAELRAARERAIVPLEARMTQFREMLLERGVTNFLLNLLHARVLCVRTGYYGTLTVMRC